ncbi:MAG TPA: thiol:disulfide interchange protein DsbA/DsbL [Steroidobacteraceae bacterium]|nr:thiol:disulfide interchange protein DsbA/DsbL [Steroidobacteraceae bacterium]
MKRLIAVLIGGLAVLLSPVLQATQTWAEGTQYELLSPAQHTTVPAGTVEVMEIFSYGCPACSQFQPVIQTLKAHLPANARMTFLPASFKPEEDWPMLQRAYFAAQALGIAERTHQAMFDAVWKTGELAIVDPVTHRLRTPAPSIEDAAKCYHHLAGVSPEAFLSTARSFGVDVRMRAADAQALAMRVPSTPCIVVNGKYRINMETMRSADDVVGLVRYLVDKESGPAAQGSSKR